VIDTPADPERLPNTDAVAARLGGDADRPLRRAGPRSAFGLHNWANWCFANSVLQLLASDAAFVSAAAAGHQPADGAAHDADACVACAVSRIFTAEVTVAQSVAALLTILTPFWDHMTWQQTPLAHRASLTAADMLRGRGRQHDAGEFLGWLRTKAVHRWMAVSMTVYKGVVSKCKECGHEFGRVEKGAAVFSLPVLDTSVDSRPFDDLFRDSFHSVEDLDGVQCDGKDCTKPRVTKRVTNTLCIAGGVQPPDSFVVELSRKPHNEQLGALAGLKTTVAVAYPSSIDLSLFAEPSSAGPCVFDLECVVVHHGERFTSGHYDTHVRHPNPGPDALADPAFAGWNAQGPT
jgi:hypothetical protein